MLISLLSFIQQMSPNATTTAGHDTLEPYSSTDVSCIPANNEMASVISDSTEVLVSVDHSSTLTSSHEEGSAHDKPLMTRAPLTHNPDDISSSDSAVLNTSVVLKPITVDNNSEETASPHNYADIMDGGNTEEPDNINTTFDIEGTATSASLLSVADSTVNSHGDFVDDSVFLDSSIGVMHISDFTFSNSAIHDPEDSIFCQTFDATPEDNVSEHDLLIESMESEISMNQTFSMDKATIDKAPHEITAYIGSDANGSIKGDESNYDKTGAIGSAASNDSLVLSGTPSSTISNCQPVNISNSTEISDALCISDNLNTIDRLKILYAETIDSSLLSDCNIGDILIQSDVSSSDDEDELAFSLSSVGTGIATELSTSFCESSSLKQDEGEFKTPPKMNNTLYDCNTTFSVDSSKPAFGKEEGTESKDSRELIDDSTELSSEIVAGGKHVCVNYVPEAISVKNDESTDKCLIDLETHSFEKDYTSNLCFNADIISAGIKECSAIKDELIISDINNSAESFCCGSLLSQINCDPVSSQESISFSDKESFITITTHVSDETNTQSSTITPKNSATAVARSLLAKKPNASKSKTTKDSGRITSSASNSARSVTSSSITMRPGSSSRTSSLSKRNSNISSDRTLGTKISKNLATRTPKDTSLNSKNSTQEHKSVSLSSNRTQKPRSSSTTRKESATNLARVKSNIASSGSISNDKQTVSSKPTSGSSLNEQRNLRLPPGKVSATSAQTRKTENRATLFKADKEEDINQVVTKFPVVCKVVKNATGLASTKVAGKVKQLPNSASSSRSTSNVSIKKHGTNVSELPAVDNRPTINKFSSEVKNRGSKTSTALGKKTSSTVANK